jgi:hypothetical protein
MDTIKQNTKVLNIIAQNALEQKKINEEKTALPSIVHTQKKCILPMSFFDMKIC